MDRDDPAWMSRRERRKLLGGYWERRRRNRKLGELIARLEVEIGPADPETFQRIAKEWLDEEWLDDG